jgi:hypothetical protein
MLPNILKNDKLMKITNWIFKNYIYLTIIFTILGIGSDIIFTDVKVISETIESVHPINGSKTFIQNFRYERLYSFLQSVSGICYSIAISIFILVFLDKKFDKHLSEQTVELQRQREEEHKIEINKLNEKIYSNIFNGILKKVIPEQLFDKFNKDIFQTDLVRKNAFWTYEIIKTQYNLFNVKQSIRYELHNINDYEFKYTLPITINSNTSYVDTKLSKIDVLNSDKTTQESFNEIDRVVYIKANDYIEVTMIVDNEYKHTSVLDVHNSMFSIIGLTIETIQPQDVSVKIQPSFLKELESINTGLTTTTKYKPIDCILQGQGITYLIENVSQIQNNIIGENRIMNE